MGSGLKKDVSENAGQQEGAAFPTEGIGDKSLPSGEDLSLILRASKGIGGSNPAEGRTFNPSRFVGMAVDFETLLLVRKGFISIVERSAGRCFSPYLWRGTWRCRRASLRYQHRHRRWDRWRPRC